MTTRHAPFPWWTEPFAFGTIVYDADGLRIAEVFRDPHNPASEQANARIIKVAPVLLLDIKMMVAILAKRNFHPDLVPYLQRTIAAAEYEPVKAKEILKLSV